jgi:hypothetical protein
MVFPFPRKYLSSGLQDVHKTDLAEHKKVHI